MTAPLKDNYSVSQRLNKLINHFENGVQARFAERIGVATGIVGGMLGKKQSKPGLELTGKILQAYPLVNERWFILGEGEMLKSAEPLKNNFVSSRPAPVELHMELPPMTDNRIGHLINYEAAANYLSGYQSQDYYQELEVVSLPRELMSSKTPFKVLYVAGESMEPTIQSQDLVFCLPIVRDRWAGFRKEFLGVVVSRSQGIQIKRITVRRDLRLVRCRSDNPNSRPFDLSLDDEGDKESDVLELWSVEWLLTKRLEAPAQETAQRFSHIENEVGDLRYLLETILDEKEMNRRLRGRDRKKDDSDKPE